MELGELRSGIYLEDHGLCDVPIFLKMLLRASSGNTGTLGPPVALQG